MLDAPVRRALAPILDRAARRLAAWGVRPGALTATGWLVGVGACTAAAMRHWSLALALWLGNRLLDGLDGPVARAGSPTERGGFLDIVADFSVYGGFVVGVAIGVPSARLACVVLLAAYYVSGTALLALSSLQERRALPGGDERSLRFAGGLAEGTETVLVYVLFCLLPQQAAGIAWGFAAAVGVTAVQRVVAGLRLLREPARTPPGARARERR
jgi:phosphatidylglycerophosphate synthase